MTKRTSKKSSVKRSSKKSSKKIVRGHFRSTPSGAKVWVAPHKARKRPASKRSTSVVASRLRGVFAARERLLAKLDVLDAQIAAHKRKRTSRKR